jgi:hypothetical protein
MRVTDDRYSRDRLRLDLALRFIRHEARTRTIRQWTGLSDDRIRKLYRSYVRSAGGAGVRRHRGKSPRQVSYFLRTPRMREDATALASVLSLFGLLPAPSATEGARQVPGVARGRVLCDAYETYLRVVGNPQIGFEHAVFLAHALAAGVEMRMPRCRHCHALAITDPLALRAPNCLCCGEALRIEASATPAGASAPMAAGAAATEASRSTAAAARGNTATARSTRPAPGAGSRWPDGGRTRA